jgi:hypothetical protein
MNDDLFNSLFNDDFFNNRMNHLNPEDFRDEDGNIDYQKLREEAFKMFEEITGRKVEDIFDMDTMTDENLFPGLTDKKMSMGFVQDLESEEGKAMFDKLIEEHGLTKESKIVKMKGKDFVHETWTNEDKTVKATRLYELNEDTSSKILSKEEQIEMYQSKLDQAVEVENYEEAAELRDIINKLKGE